MSNEMAKISTYTVGSGGISTISFSSIPQTYTHLLLKISAEASAGAGSILVKANGNSSNYATVQLAGNGTTTVATTGVGAGTSAYDAGLTSDIANYGNYFFSTTDMFIPNYTNSGYKPVSVDNNNEKAGVGAYLVMSGSLWSNTSAITSLDLTIQGSGTFAQYTKADLYGLTATYTGAKATGGVITSDSTYYYHTFYTSGVFTPNQTVSADYLVVAGGGGGGSTFGDWGGGPGGAGGYRTFSGVSFANATNYAVTIGAGGTSTAGAGSTGGKGGNSSVIGGAISSTSTGGGGGGTTKENGGVQTNGQAGGSGGGAPQNTISVSAGTGNQGGYTPVEGYAGGAVNGNSPYVAGQGGGASAVGLSNSAQSPTGIATTNGTSNSISGTSVVYSRGGYFITSVTSTLNGPANSGWGGLTSNPNGANGAGGSGIVIIRYAK